MSFEKQLIDEINKVRASPNSYVSKLTESKKYFDKNIWKHPDIPRGIETKDGARAKSDHPAIHGTYDTRPYATLIVSLFRQPPQNAR